jgi:phage shock protein A
MKTNDKMNERIQDRIPDALIIIKKGDLSPTDLSVYDIIARHYGLRYKGRDIYIDYWGNEFVRTKYGFQPALRENLAAQLAESESRRRKSTAHYERQISNLRALLKEQKTRLNKKIMELHDQLADVKRENWFAPLTLPNRYR